MNDKLKESLIKLCDFKYSQKWRLIYRASDHGYLGRDFHSKCNSIKNTITIIQTIDNFIFGGYTDKAWSGEAGYIRDDKAFLFSLVNKIMYPLRIECSDPKHAIYNNSGPFFISQGENLKL